MSGYASTDNGERSTESDEDLRPRKGDVSLWGRGMFEDYLYERGDGRGDKDSRSVAAARIEG